MYSIKSKLDIGLFVDLAEFQKLFCRSKQNNFMMLMLDLVKNVNSARSTNNPMSSFGLIEYNLELSHIY